MPHINPGTQIFNESYNTTKGFNNNNLILGNLLITNTGDAVENLTAEPSLKWIEACWDAECKNVCKKEICLPEDGNAALILKYSNGDPYKGEHKGELRISSKTKTIYFWNLKLIESRCCNFTIPMRLAIN